MVDTVLGSPMCLTGVRAMLMHTPDAAAATAATISAATGGPTMPARAYAAASSTKPTANVAASAPAQESAFSVAELYFELNDTDGDLGIHSLIDGEPWQWLEIEDPAERVMLQIRVANRLRRQGLTEIFFESAEPPFDELPPAQFFQRFPEGIYEISGVTLAGEELESKARISHLLPAPPQIFVGGQPASEDCDEDPGPSVHAPFEIRWPAVTHSHPELGRTNKPVRIVRYELIVERPGDPTVPFKMTVALGPDATSFPFPAGLVGSEDMKVEVLAREAGGNQTATEACFQVQ